MLGEGLVGSIGMVVDGPGTRVHLVWPYETVEETYHLRYVQLDAQGEIDIQRDFDFEGLLKSPRLLPAGSQGYHLFWGSRIPGEREWTMWRARLNADGELESEPRALSLPGESAGSFAVVEMPEGGAMVAWDSEGVGPLYAARIDAAGQLISGPEVVFGRGELPALQADRLGNVYLAWREGKSFYYAFLPAGEVGRADVVEAVDLQDWGTLGSIGDILAGPALGYAEGNIYILWSVLSKSDTTAGTAVTEYIVFPAEAPVADSPERVYLLGVEEQPYFPYQGDLALSEVGLPQDFAEAAETYGEIVQNYSAMHGDWADVVGAVSDFIMNPQAMQGAGDELVVALAVTQERRQDNNLEVGVALFEDGRYAGYSIASRTAGLSDNPLVAVDTAGGLHLAWREGVGGGAVYYATTAPEGRTALDRMGLGDVFTLGMQAGLEGVATLLFLPFVGFWWILPGLLVLGVWQFVRDRPAETQLAYWGPLVLAIGLYTFLKIVYLPGILTYVPFSAWTYIPGGLHTALRLAVPLIITGLALSVGLLVRRRTSRSVFPFFLAFTLTDATLTLLIYGVNFLGAF